MNNDDQLTRFEEGGIAKADPNYHGRTIRNRVEIAEDLVKNDVYQNMSSLVHHLTEVYPAEWDALSDVIGGDINQQWAVSDKLGEKLKEKGEAVMEYLGIVIWGRATFGQLICMDSVIEDISRDMLL